MITNYLSTYSSCILPPEYARRSLRRFASPAPHKTS